MSELAIHGGPKTKTTPFNRSNRYGQEEMDLLREVVDSGWLMGPGSMVEEFEEEVKKAFGIGYVAMVTLGTAALHTALAALGVAEGMRWSSRPWSTSARPRPFWRYAAEEPA